MSGKHFVVGKVTPETKPDVAAEGPMSPLGLRWFETSLQQAKHILWTPQQQNSPQAPPVVMKLPAAQGDADAVAPHERAAKSQQSESCARLSNCMQ